MRKFGVLLFLICSLSLPACVSGPEKPEEQKAFADRLAESYKAYERASSAEQRSQSIESRKELMAQWGASPEFSEWVCTVHDVLAARVPDDPRKMLALPLRCGEFTITNILERSPDEAVPAGAILEGTNFYDTTLQLNMQETVIVSGRFMVTDSGRIRETSLTEYGSMRNPEFGVIYTYISPARK